MKKYVIAATVVAVGAATFAVILALGSGDETPESAVDVAPAAVPEAEPAEGSSAAHAEEDEKEEGPKQNAESARERPPHVGPVVKAVPKRYAAPKPQDEKLSAFVNRKSTEHRIPSDITTRMPRVEHAKDVPLIVSVMKDRKDSDAARHEAVNLLRRSGYSRLTQDLIETLDDPREGARFRAFCTQHLWCNHEKARPEERAVIEAKLRELLEDKERAVRREALLALVRLGDPLGEKTAVEWLHDDERTKVRDLTIRCVRELGLKEHLPRVREIVGDEDETETARAAAIFTLSQWEDRESLPVIRQAARARSLRVQKAAGAAIRRLGASPRPAVRE